jgi:toxin HigB-1
MNIIFKDNKLKKYANNDSLAIRKLGKIRAKIYKARLDDISVAESIEELRNVPGNYHELTQNRKGQWACDLDQPYRLIFEPQENPIPVDDDGKYIWIEIKGVKIKEIINYHKER